MRWERSLVLVLLVPIALSGCTSLTTVPPVQSPQVVTAGVPPLDPAEPSPVTENDGWCVLTFRDTKYYLCNIHYHSPVEHGRPVDSKNVMPPCDESGTRPEDWAEIHYAFATPPIKGACGVLRELALKTALGPGCPSPYIVRTVWVKIGETGGFDPTKDDLMPAARYVEYDGSTTGGTNGKFPAHWKINRKCEEVAKQSLEHVHQDPNRVLQRPAPLTTTEDR